MLFNITTLSDPQHRNLTKTEVSLGVGCRGVKYTKGTSFLAGRGCREVGEERKEDTGALTYEYFCPRIMDAFLETRARQ